MRKLTVFNQISVDGYFKTPSGDIGWMHGQDDGDEEFKKFSTDNAVAGGVLLRIAIGSPGSLFIFFTDATRSSLTTVVLFHDGLSNVFENTTFGRRFIWEAAA